MPKSRKKLTGKTVKNKNMPRVKKSRAQGIDGEFFLRTTRIPQSRPLEWRRANVLKPVDDGVDIDDLVKAMVYPQTKGYWDQDRNTGKF